MTIDIPNPWQQHAQIRASHPALIFDDGKELRSLSYSELWASIQDTTHQQRHQNNIEPKDKRNYIVHLLAALCSHRAPVVSEMGLVLNDSLQKRDDHHWPSIRLSQTALTIQTSGSSGQPKSVALPWQALFFGAMGHAIRVGHLPSDRWLCTLPMHHIAGISILIRAALMGTTVLILERFDAERVWHHFEHSKITLCSLVPTMVHRLVRHAHQTKAPHDSHHLRAILVGGAPIQGSLLDQARSLGLPVIRTWGMTESAAQIATEFPVDISQYTMASKPSAQPGAGIPVLPFVKAWHEPQHDDRLVFDGPQNPTPAAAWQTQDKGRVSDGYVQIEGRLDRVILSGGKNLDLNRVQNALHDSSPSLSFVFAHPHRQWGQSAIAVLELEQAQDPIDYHAQLIRSLTKHLQGWEIPKHWIFIQVRSAGPSNPSQQTHDDTQLFAAAEHAVHKNKLDAALKQQLVERLLGRLCNITGVIDDDTYSSQQSKEFGVVANPTQAIPFFVHKTVSVLDANQGLRPLSVIIREERKGQTKTRALRIGTDFHINDERIS